MEKKPDPESEMEIRKEAPNWWVPFLKTAHHLPQPTSSPAVLRPLWPHELTQTSLLWVVHNLAATGQPELSGRPREVGLLLDHRGDKPNESWVLQRGDGLEVLLEFLRQCQVETLCIYSTKEHPPHDKGMSMLAEQLHTVPTLSKLELRRVRHDVHGYRITSVCWNFVWFLRKVLAAPECRITELAVSIDFGGRRRIVDSFVRLLAKKSILEKVCLTCCTGVAAHHLSSIVFALKNTATLRHFHLEEVDSLSELGTLDVLEPLVQHHPDLETLQMSLRYSNPDHIPTAVLLQESLLLHGSNLRVIQLPLGLDGSASTTLPLFHRCLSPITVLQSLDVGMLAIENGALGSRVTVRAHNPNGGGHLALLTNPGTIGAFGHVHSLKIDDFSRPNMVTHFRNVFLDPSCNITELSVSGYRGGSRELVSSLKDYTKLTKLTVTGFLADDVAIEEGMMLCPQSRLAEAVFRFTRSATSAIFDSLATFLQEQQELQCVRFCSWWRATNDTFVCPVVFLLALAHHPTLRSISGCRPLSYDLFTVAAAIQNNTVLCQFDDLGPGVSAALDSTLRRNRLLRLSNRSTSEITVASSFLPCLLERLGCNEKEGSPLFNFLRKAPHVLSYQSADIVDGGT